MKFTALTRLERNIPRVGEIIGVLAKYGLADSVNGSWNAEEYLAASSTLIHLHLPCPLSGPQTKPLPNARIGNLPRTPQWISL
jgi:hypothetical protein